LPDDRRFRLVDFTPELAAREILATVADPLIVCDSAGRVRLLNPAAASVLDRRPEEILGRPIAELVPPTEQDRLAAVLAGGEIRDQSLDLRARDGGAVPVELAVSPLRDRGGAVVGSVLVARDARPHLRAQAALAASEARYRALFEANPIPGTILPSLPRSRIRPEISPTPGVAASPVAGGAAGGAGAT
jgi:PAS domain S-box-containing protein